MNSVLLQILAPIAMAVSTGLAGLIAYYFKVGTTKLKAEADIKLSENDRKIADQLIYDVTDCINTAVVQANQTIVESLKNAATDGKLSKSDSTKIFTEVVSNAKTLIGTSMYAELEKLKPNAEAWILAKVNYYVNLNKTTTTSLTPIQTASIEVDNPINVDSSTSVETLNDTLTSDTATATVITKTTL